MKQFIFNLFQNLLALGNLTLSRKMVAIGRERLFDFNQMPDSVRFSSLDLVADEINSKNVKGSIAELGVYQGKFAKEMNLCFPDRKFYLFDTFEGFDQKDISIEKKLGYSKGDQDFSKTSVDLVLSKMINVQNCIIKKGYFPETAKDLDEQFAFVSIDTDLYEPIYHGLKYFYPRLNAGGYIFVHDYNDAEYPGAKDAVRKFSAETNTPYFPLSDGWGTCVFLK